MVLLKISRRFRFDHKEETKRPSSGMYRTALRVEGQGEEGEGELRAIKATQIGVVREESKEGAERVRETRGRG